eukprot:12200603-Ditylum_brightwellii.AAC.1
MMRTKESPGELDKEMKIEEVDALCGLVEGVMGAGKLLEDVEMGEEQVGEDKERVKKREWRKRGGRVGPDTIFSEKGCDSTRAMDRTESISP